MIKTCTNFAVFVFFATAIGTFFIIFATPLRYASLLMPQINDISPKIFYQKYIKNPEKYLFIDVRNEEAFNKIHAAGAVNKPLHTLYDERHTLPLKGKEIVLICGGNRASGIAYSYLEHHGFRNIQRINGGIEVWIEQNLPIESKESYN